MIDQVDRGLQEWVVGVLGEVDISLDPPSKALPARGVGLYLMELAPRSAPGGAKAPPLQFGARYLVTTWAEEPAVAHRDLSELAFAAMETADFEVDFEPPSAATWTAFGVAPRPAFSIRMPVRRARSERPAYFVRMPVIVKPSVIAGLSGAVFGPGDVPLTGARVELALLGLATRTDDQGRFRFDTVPADKPLRLRVQAKGREQEFAAQPGGNEPLIVRMRW